ncbi:hypothetical protein HD806DRAFT_547029 [Xylariaceae sp. AK1471]|nr:hypothetical protein HD806DRAFT_547029 [Xylariaceae sp. AK1471]
MKPFISFFLKFLAISASSALDFGLDLSHAVEKRDIVVNNDCCKGVTEILSAVPDARPAAMSLCKSSLKIPNRITVPVTMVPTTTKIVTASTTVSSFKCPSLPKRTPKARLEMEMEIRALGARRPNKISSACKCLGLAAKTTTKTITVPAASSPLAWLHVRSAARLAITLRTAALAIAIPLVSTGTA